MKNQKYIWLVAILVLAFVAWRISRPKILPPQPAPVVNATPINAPNPAPASTPVANKPFPVSPLNQANSAVLADIDTQYRAGVISKGQAMQETINQENKKPLDIYGKVVDQYGEPVVEAEVEGSILLNVSFVKSGTDRHSTVTDSQGRFSFVGISGVGIGIRPSKDGYIYNAKMPSQRPNDYAPDPNNPLVFTMWRLRGAEHLVSVSFVSTITADGAPTTFDIATQKKNPNGDLQLTLLRSPSNVKRSGQKFDWTCEIELLHGGILPETDSYPYWAPDSGYESVFNFNMSSNNVPWHSTITQNFYLRSSHGQYGRMQVTVYSAVTPARVKFDLTVNPSGSQNLEPSPSN